MWRNHWGFRLGTSVAAMGVVLVTLGTGVAAQGAATTYPPRPQVQTTGTPTPVPPSSVVLSQPKDMYLHQGAPTEWWWYTGTLHSGSRTFGFEINAASFIKQGFAFSQLSLTDVQNQKHYQRTTPYIPPKAFNGSTWAQSNITKPWSAHLGSSTQPLSGVQVTNAGTGYTKASVTFTGNGKGATGRVTLDKTGGVGGVLVTNPGTGYTKPPKVVVTGDGTGATATAFNSWVSATAPASNPTKNMHVQGLLVDDPTMTKVKYDLTFSQVGKPFYVWGTGVDPLATHESLTENNYYFSLTNLQAKGTITVGGKKFPVTGVTWMDHEYGSFGSADHPVQWILQDLHLANGWTISNAGVVDTGKKPELNVPFSGYATLESPTGKMYFVASTVTPTGATWTSPQSGKTYFMNLNIDIPTFNAQITATSSMPSQEFPGAVSVYEGVGTAKGTFQGTPTTAEAWIEETF
jgi:predicted secreted hydrolase